MTKNEKKKIIEEMAEKFMNIGDIEKTVVIMTLSAYAEGKAAGKEEERRKWKKVISAI